MGFKDYIITLYNNNYTGVRDLYKYDAGNDYPCWDVLYQCSVGNTTKGTMDLLNRVGGRQAERGGRRLPIDMVLTASAVLLCSVATTVATASTVHCALQLVHC
jgi:hypothetical protein